MAPLLPFAAALALPAAPYPVREMLDAFARTCLVAPLASEEPLGAVATWREAARSEGWTEVGAPPPGTSFETRNAYRAYHSILALDYDLFSALLSTGEARMERALLHKTVAGRRVYLSTLAVDANNPTLVECRLFDPLGDGVAKVPVTRDAIARWTGRPVATTRGPYRSKQYSWESDAGVQAMRVHFGFAGKPFGKYGARYDPYALYGMTLVRSVFQQEIIVT